MSDPSRDPSYSLPKEHVVLHLVCLILVILFAAVLAVHDPNPQDKLLGVVVVINAVQVVAETWVGKQA